MARRAPNLNLSGDQQAHARVLDEVGRLRQRRRPRLRVHAELQQQPRRLPGRPQRAGGRRQIRGRDRQRQRPQHRLLHPPERRRVAPLRARSRLHRRRRGPDQALRRRPAGALQQDDVGHGGGQFRQLDLYFMSRADQRPFRRRQPRRGGHLRPGAAARARSPSTSAATARRRSPPSRPPRTRLRPASRSASTARARKTPTARSPSTSGTSTATAASRPTPAPTPTTTATYSTPGTYNVKLRVTDNEGSTVQTTNTITVEQSGSGSYAARVLATAGLTNYWRLGDTSGTTLSDSKGGVDATTLGTPTLGAAGALPSDTDKAIDFNGTSDAAQADLDLSGTNKLTLEFWMKWNAFANDDDLAFEFTPNFNSNPGGFLVDPNAPEEGGKFAVGIGNGSARNTAYFDPPERRRLAPLRPRARHQRGRRRPDQPLRRRPAGALHQDDVGTGAGNFANSTLYFMSRAGSALFGGGDLDEVALYNRALSAATIDDHFSGTAGGSASPRHRRSRSRRTQPRAVRRSPSTPRHPTTPTARSPNTSGTSTATAPSRPIPARRQRQPRATPPPDSRRAPAPDRQ